MSRAGRRPGEDRAGVPVEASVAAAFWAMSPGRCRDDDLPAAGAQQAAALEKGVHRFMQTAQGLGFQGDDATDSARTPWTLFIASVRLTFGRLSRTLPGGMQSGESLCSCAGIPIGPMRGEGKVGQATGSTTKIVL